jgi:hypothetical protein
MGFAATTLANAAGSLIAWAVEQVYGSGSADVLRERVRERLGRQPHKLSLELALARTEERFAREHPTWHARFFDMVFLCGPAVPLLGRALTSTENVTASELAQAWGEHFGGKTGRGLAEEAEGPAEDFLKWWHEELRRLEVFREPLDSRALDHIAQSTQETVDQLRGLHAQLLDALAERDAAVLRSRYPDLDDFLDWPSHRLEPAAAQFVGREWVFRFLDEFAAAHRSGYVRIIADAGLGKTALAAAVAGRYGAPAFCFSETAGRTRADQCLNHLAVELILDRQLAYEHLPEHAGQSASFLARLLHEVAAAARPVWVVIDALDEVDCSSGGTRLPLPDRLPGGAFVVLTHRDGVPAPLVAPGSDLHR